MSTIEKKSLKVGKYVNTEHVDTVIRTYKKERWVHNSERMGKPDSLSAWYSVEELEEFLDKAKQHGGDGIKMYFAAYPENYTATPEYAGLQTLVLVATKSKETENGIANKDIYFTKDGSTEILAYNASRLCPPFCGSGVEFGKIGVTIIDNGIDGLSVI
ncbi:MAG: hypothetical protein JST96_05190 [Bacteroidetes bacterium]|nr:hypothetical protein [Bacteroidota bacterium]